MNNFEMPVMELVSFSADDIIRTSDGSDANGFTIGTENTVKRTRVSMSDPTIASKWAEAVSTKMEY